MNDLRLLSLSARCVVSRVSCHFIGPHRWMSFLFGSQGPCLSVQKIGNSNSNKVSRRKPDQERQSTTTLSFLSIFNSFIQQIKIIFKSGKGTFLHYL
mmetsp:Transcript_2082/g.2275  ORF Transcript_2082/g.2275 Transcript_2082/m.2275 type:complete len:97 (+) Transcript_2082:502-792(+)